MESTGFYTTPSVEELCHSSLYKLATDHWLAVDPPLNAPSPKKRGSKSVKAKKFDLNLVKKIYHNDIMTQTFPCRAVSILEYIKYLENYLWPNFATKNLKELSKTAHPFIMSIVVLINEKFRAKCHNPIKCITPDIEKLDLFLDHVIRTVEKNDKSLLLSERIQLIKFMNNIFNSMEIASLNQVLMPFVSIATWKNLIEARRDQEFRVRSSRYKTVYENNLKKLQSDDVEQNSKLERKYNFFALLIQQFILLLNSIEHTEDSVCLSDKISLLENMLIFFVDIMCPSDKKIYYRTVRQFSSNCMILAVGWNCCKISEFYTNAEFNSSGLNSHFKKIFNVLATYIHMNIDWKDGHILSENEVIKLYSEKVLKLQKILFQLFPDNESVREFCMGTFSTIDIDQPLNALAVVDIDHVCQKMQLVDPQTNNLSNSYLQNLIRNKFSEDGYDCHFVFIKFMEQFMNSPLFPTEKNIWNVDCMFGCDNIVAHPRINVQFLSITDYLLRNYYLYFLEVASQIKYDVEDALSRMRPKLDIYGELEFGGWSRMAQPVERFQITQVGQNNIGQKHPCSVKASFIIPLNLRKQYVNEWKDSLKPDDSCFVVSLSKIQSIDSSSDFRSKYGVVALRGCTVEEINFSSKNDIDSNVDNQLNVNVQLDPIQYQMDSNDDKLDIYKSVCVVVRKKPKENTFRQCLSTIKQLIIESYRPQNEAVLVPDWLKGVVVGTASPESAHYSKLESYPYTVNFPNTFQDEQHLRECFSQFSNIKFDGDGDNYSCVEFLSDDEIAVHRSSLPQCIPQHVRFTEIQIEAIKSGSLRGLTMIVGPPGTGKTDVAAKILTNLLQNVIQHQILVLAHSNQALNQIFEKLIDCGVNEQYLLRLGHGEESLDTHKDFSRTGRINYILNRRLELLEIVGQLEQSLDIPQAEHTCETAYNFYRYYIIKQINDFNQLTTTQNDSSAIKTNFPFKRYFSNIDWEDPQFLLSMDDAQECFKTIEGVFEELKEYRAFELITTAQGRSNYILVKMAKIIAMTCTYASLRRDDLIKMGLQYDSVLMEESAQMLEIETFIPLTLQKDSAKRLQRLILIGDHHQLPPVIKNIPLRQFSNIDQSMFQRFCRLGVRCIQLDFQGRCRPAIYDLIGFQYENVIKHLPHVYSFDKLAGNAGFAFTYQFINIQYNSKCDDKIHSEMVVESRKRKTKSNTTTSSSNLELVSESEPVPFYYQNQSEAEFAVSLYIYMRMIGYPANKITILAMYNGQKHLIRDIVDKRCSNNPLLGRPLKITTVDRYQGQQNDFVIVSMTRTNSIGYLRDLRRLVVAFSRGRLGLYVLGHLPLFEKYDEFRNILRLFKSNPTELTLYPNEYYGDKGLTAKISKHATSATVIATAQDMFDLSHNMYMQKYEQLQEQYDRELKVEEQRSLVDPLAVESNPDLIEMADSTEEVAIHNEIYDN